MTEHVYCEVFGLRELFAQRVDKYPGELIGETDLLRYVRIFVETGKSNDLDESQLDPHFLKLLKTETTLALKSFNLQVIQSRYQSKPGKALSAPQQTHVNR